MNITDEQWKIIEPHIPEGKSGKDKPGRPAIDFRAVLNGILWILRTGAPWHDLPRRHAPYQTCHRRFQEWVEASVMQAILKSIWDDLRVRGGIKDIEGFIDGSYVPVKKRGSRRQMPGWQCDKNHGNCKQRWSSTRYLSCPWK